MTSNNLYRAYSMEYGTFVGISWAMIFLSYVYGVRTSNPLLFLLCFAMLGLGFILPLLFGFRINWKYARVNDKLSYIQGLFFAFNMFVFACLLNGLTTYAYFEFFDEGMLTSGILKMFEEANMMETYTQIGMGDSYKEMMALLNEADSLSSLEKALIIFNNNFFYGCIMSFIVALLAAHNRRNVNPDSTNR